jgi:hypothetical protein
MEQLVIEVILRARVLIQMLLFLKWQANRSQITEERKLFPEPLSEPKRLISDSLVVFFGDSKSLSLFQIIDLLPILSNR